MSSLRTTLLRALLALGLSFALWAFVSFSQNPEETVSFPDVPLQVVGLRGGLVLVDSNGLPNPALPGIAITLRTDQLQVNVLRPLDIRAVLDLGALGPGQHSVPVNVQPTRSNLSFSVPENGVEPSVIAVRIEQLITRTLPIDLRIRGNLPFSFERGDPQLTYAGAPIAEVEVSGPQSLVERIAVANATANIEQLRGTYDAPLDLNPVDQGGQTVEGVTVVPAQVTVQIPINPVVGLRLVPVAPEFVGQPAPGFAVTAVEVEPPLIALAGSSGPLDAVVALATAAVDISGAGATIVRETPLIFPNGTSARAGDPTEVTVTVRIAPIARPFQIELPAQVSLTGLGGGLLVSSNPTVVTLTVAGATTALDALASQPLRVSVEVGGLGPGVYQLPVQLTLPAGVSLVGDPPLVTVTVRNPPAPPPTSAPPVAPPVTPTPPVAPTAPPVAPTAPTAPTATAAPPAEPTATAAPPAEPTAAPAPTAAP